MPDKTIGQFFIANPFTTPAKTDAIPIGRDPSGTPSTGGMTWATLKQAIVDPRTTTVTLTAAEIGSVITNEGATGLLAVNLPSCAAGLVFECYVQDADGVQLTALAGDTVRIGGSVSSGGGTCTSTTVGSYLKLLGINSVEWVALSSVGVWTLA